MDSMSSRMFSSCLLSSLLHPRRRRSHHARVFDADSDSDTGPSPSCTFQTDLTQRLQKLNPHDDANTCSTSKSDHQMVSLTWICQAFDVVISTQQSVNRALCTNTGAMGHSSCSETQKIMQHCMDDSIKMLDVCSLLKETLDEVHAHVKASHLALKRLQGLKLVTLGDIQRARHALLSAKEGDEQSKAPTPHSTKRLQACRHMLRKMGEKLSDPTTVHFEDFKTGSSMAALYGGQICTLFFLKLLATALSSPRRSSSSMTSTLQLPGRPVWGPALLDLQAQLHKELSVQNEAQRRSCGTALLREMCTLNSSLHQVYESLRDVPSTKQARQDVQEVVHSTSLLVDHLQTSMARLHHQLDRISISLMDMQMVLLKELR